MGRITPLTAPPSGMTAGRVTTGSIAGASSATVTFTLPTPMANTNYTVQAAVQDTNFDLSVKAIVARTTTTVTVRITNNNAVTARTGTLHVIAVPD